MKILFIGNSYTYYNDMPVLFGKLCEKNGKDVQVFSVTKGARKLMENLNAEDEITKELDRIIAENKMDICFLQEQSISPVTKFDVFEHGSTELVKKLAPQVEQFIFYATWGRKTGHQFLEENGLTNRTMTEQLAAAYGKMAKQLGAGISHVGTCFTDVYENHPEIELYDPDMSHPSYKGSCLSAMTHFRTVFGQLPADTSCLELTEEEAAIFKESIAKL